MMRIPLMIAVWLLLALGAIATIHAQEDLDPPHLVSMTFDPPIIDTSNGPATITATIHITDDLSGMWDVAIYFRKPGTTQAGMIEVRNDGGWPPPISGDALDGEWRDTMTLPRYSAQGTWEMYYVGMQDIVGNRIDSQKPDSSQDDGSWPEIFNGFAFAVSQFDTEPEPNNKLFMPMLSAKNIKP